MDWRGTCFLRGRVSILMPKPKEGGERVAQVGKPLGGEFVTS